MARINNLKRIVKEDFDQEYHGLIDKLAYSLNPFLEQISNAFNKNITLENLSREVLTVTVENDGSDVLKTTTQFKTNLTSRIQGLTIIKAENLTNPSVYPTASPWISWTINSNIITIKKVTGIQPNAKYRLTMEIIS